MVPPEKRPDSIGDGQKSQREMWLLQPARASPFVISGLGSRRSVVGGSSSPTSGSFPSLARLQQRNNGSCATRKMRENEIERESVCVCVCGTRRAGREGKVADIDWPRRQNLKCPSHKCGATWHPLVG